MLSSVFPEEVVEQLEAVEARLDTDIHLIGRFYYPGNDTQLVLDTIDRISDEVVPEV